MRTAAEFRERQLKTLAMALKRPSMFCGYGGAADNYFGDMLRDLSWIDAREEVFDSVASQLLRGSLRVFGQFRYQNLEMPENFCNEIASTYAEVAFILGYFTPRRLLTEKEFSALQSDINSEFLACDHTESQLVTRFGPPVHDVLGGDTTVHSYGCENRSIHWIHFDYERRPRLANSESMEWLDDPILRDVRRNQNLIELLPCAQWRRRCKAEDDNDSKP